MSSKFRVPYVFVSAGNVDGYAAIQEHHACLNADMQIQMQMKMNAQMIHITECTVSPKTAMRKQTFSDIVLKIHEQIMTLER